MVWFKKRNWIENFYEPPRHSSELETEQITESPSSLLWCPHHLMGQVNWKVITSLTSDTGELPPSYLNPVPEYRGDQEIHLTCGRAVKKRRRKFIRYPVQSVFCVRNALSSVVVFKRIIQTSSAHWRAKWWNRKKKIIHNLLPFSCKYPELELQDKYNHLCLKIKRRNKA